MSYPRELFEELERSGRALEEHAPGIYYVRGNVLFDTQIVVTGRLSQEAHSGLRILSKSAQEADIRTFITKTRCLTEQGDRHDAVLQVSISANAGERHGQCPPFFHNQFDGHNEVDSRAGDGCNKNSIS